MGLQVKPEGHSLRRVHQLPVRLSPRALEPQSLLPRRGKELFPALAASSDIASPLEPLPQSSRWCGHQLLGQPKWGGLSQ